MKKLTKKLTRTESHYYRLILVILLSMIITRFFIVSSKQYGEYGLFIIGIILGGLWGKVFDMLFSKRTKWGWDTLPPFAYIITIII